MVKWIRNIRWKVVLGCVVALLAVSGIVALMSFIGVKSSEQACTGLRVIVLGEESFIEQKDVVDIIEQAHGQIVGRTLETLPYHEIEESIEALPYVAEAIVSRDMDGIVTVRIQQRQAVVRVINSEGKNFYIDEAGLKIPVSLKYAPRVPVANGHIAEPYNEALDSIQNALVNDIFKTAQYISADSVWSNQVVQLYVNQQGDIELAPRVGRQQIILGNSEALEEKFQKLMLFYTKIVPRVGIDAYKSVNLKYRGQLVCERGEGYRPELFEPPDQPPMPDSLGGPPEMAD